MFIQLMTASRGEDVRRHIDCNSLPTDWKKHEKNIRHIKYI